MSKEPPGSIVTKPLKKSFSKKRMHAYIFLGGGTTFLLGVFVGVYHGEGTFHWLNLSREIIHCGNLPEFLYKILFLCLAFSFLSHSDARSG